MEPSLREIFTADPARQMKLHEIDGYYPSWIRHSDAAAAELCNIFGQKAEYYDLKTWEKTHPHAGRMAWDTILRAEGKLPSQHPRVADTSGVSKKGILNTLYGFFFKGP